VTAPYPEPPHLIGGLALRGHGPDAARDRLASVVRQLGGSGGCAAQPADGEDAAFGLVAPDGGPLLIEAIFGDAVPDGDTGVQFVLSGELVSLPDTVALEPDELALAARVRGCVHALFAAACEDLDPLYGGVDVEWRLPSATDLAAATATARLPADLYLSGAVLGGDAALVAEIADLYGIEPLGFAGGVLFPGGGVLVPDHPVMADPVVAGRAAAARLARAL
jgi:hypothetical protein